MTSDTEREIYRAFVGGQERHVYFLLAAAGAAIAFAVTRTEASAWSEWMLVWCLAVACWGGSFFSGVQYMRWIGAGLYSNMGLLRVQSGRDDISGTNPQLIAMAEGIIKDAIGKGSHKSAAYARAQIAFLILGALTYVAWHLGEIVWRAAPLASGA